MPITVHNTMAVVYIHTYTSRASNCSGGIFQKLYYQNPQTKPPKGAHKKNRAFISPFKRGSFLPYVL